MQEQPDVDVDNLITRLLAGAAPITACHVYASYSVRSFSSETAPTARLSQLKQMKNVKSFLD